MLHIIVGNTGAGKTTYAQNLKQASNAVLFSIDEWNNTLFMADKTPNDGLDWLLERIERNENMIMALIKQLEQANIDSLLDLGFSKFEHREKFKKFAIQNNFESKIHFIDLDKQTRKNRITKRNIEQGDSYQFEVSDADFEFMETWFETPTESELKNSIIVNS